MNTQMKYALACAVLALASFGFAEPLRVGVVKADDPLPDLADVRKRLPELFKGCEDTFQCERLWKRLEQAERLQSLPKRSRLMQAELDEFRRYFKEAFELWAVDPANPSVKPVAFDLTRDFGAKGDGVTDDAPAFARAREAIRALNGKPSVLRLGAGDFYIGGAGVRCPEGGVSNISFDGVTNCLVTGESPEKTRLLFGVYEARGISLLQSCNLTVARVNCAWKERPFSQTVLESYDPKTATAIVRWTPGTLRPDDPRYRRSDHAQVICVFAADGKKIVNPGALLFFDLKADDLGDGRYRIYFDRKRPGCEKFNVPPGSYLVLPDRDNRFGGTLVYGSRFCTFSEVWFRNARSSAVCGGLAHYFTGWKLKTFPDDDPAIVFSSNADTFYCSRGSYLAHSEFHHMCDDGANSLGYGSPVVRVEGPRTVVARRNGGQARPGDIVQIMEVMTGRFRADDLVIVKAERFTEGKAKRLWRLTLDRDLPAGVITLAEAGEMDAKTRYAISHGLGKVPKAADLLYLPLQFGTGFTVFDNRIHDLRGCGINVQCPHSLVESNVIERVGTGLKMTGLTEWFEGTPPSDVVVSHNVFRGCDVGIFSCFNTVNARLANEKPLKYLEIRDNVFEDVTRPLVLNNVSDSDIRLGEGSAWEIQAKKAPADKDTTLRAADADRIRVSAGDGTGARRIVYAFVDGDEPVSDVTVTLERGASGETRGRIAATPRKGWHLHRVRYPLVDLPLVRGTDPTDDCLLTGTAKGGYYTNPAGMEPGAWMMNARHPGQSAAQFAAAWDGDSGVYFGLEDTQGNPKEYGFRRLATGVEFYNHSLVWTDRPWELGYPAVIRHVTRTDEKLTWYDFADIYREWDRRQVWSRTPYQARTDIPAWMKDAPAFVRFSRQWLEKPEEMKRFVEMWKREMGEMPVVAALWGWEKHGTWWGPDYFPCHPDDRTFRSEMDHLKANGFHPFAWPSGYNWSKYIGDKGDGTYEKDFRRDWIDPNAAHLCVNPDGKLFHRDAFWLRNGALTTICGGDTWSQDWWNGVTKGLAERGCELVQVDQVVGGRINECWSTAHGHPAGRGAWQWAAFRRQLDSMRETMRSVCPDGLVGVEEPCELMNHLVGIQDYRDMETYGDRLADVYGYLYHGYVPAFQSNPFRDEMISTVTCAVNGQMPFYRPDFAELESSRPALVNGGFENLVDSVRGPTGWDRLIPDRLLRGVDPSKPLWNFTGYNNMGWFGYSVTLDGDVKHSGDFSLKFDPPAKGGRDKGAPMQVSQTVEELLPGDYTVSAWVRCDDVTAPTGELKLGFVDSGEAQAIRFPAVAGWTKVEGKVTVRDHLRLILWAPPGARFHVDDLKLERDGAEVTVGGDSKYTRFLKRWIALYRGEGRDFLANGFRTKPPQLDCATVRFAAREEPAVVVAAYRSAKGDEALVFGNPTAHAQTFSYRWKGTSQTRTIAVHSLELVRFR